MGNFSTPDANMIQNEDAPSNIRPLTDKEKEIMAGKRLKYLETRYPPQKPLDKTKKMADSSSDLKKHEQYIKDLLS